MKIQFHICETNTRQNRTVKIEQKEIEVDNSGRGELELKEKKLLQIEKDEMELLTQRH